MRDLRLPKREYCFLLILLCFFWTSASFLSWLYHLTELFDAGTADVVSEVVSYLLQAGGIGLFILADVRRPVLAGRWAFTAATALDIACVLLSVLTERIAVTLSAGLLMNLLHGFVAGFYLRELAARETARPATVFGLGYGLAVIAAWLLSLPGQSSFLRSPYVLIIYGAAAALSAVLVLTDRQTPGISKSDGRPLSGEEKKTLLLLTVTAVLISLVKNMGFSFPSEDLGTGTNLELSRLFYGAGLALAGILIDRRRQYGFLLCAAALILPFIMLLLSQEAVSRTALWCADYFFYGFFSVFRIVLFTDAAAQSGRLWMSGLGLLLGRVGDALGTRLYILLNDDVSLVILASLLFIVTVIVLFALYHRLVSADAAAATAPTEPPVDAFEEFVARFGISKREQDVLRLLLDKRSNSEISERLSVSENTVKFHVRNILQKTECKNRVELIEKYNEPALPSSQA